MSEITAPTIEFLLVADRAEIVNGKLYLMGGCWDRIQLPGLEPAVMMSAGVAMRVLIPAEDTGTHVVKLTVEAGGTVELVPDQFQFVRSADPSPAGTGPLAVLLASECYFGIKGPGLHVLRAQIDGGHSVTTQFVVTVSATQPAIATR